MLWGCAQLLQRVEVAPGRGLPQCRRVQGLAPCGARPLLFRRWALRRGRPQRWRVQHPRVGPRTRCCSCTAVLRSKPRFVSACDVRTEPASHSPTAECSREIVITRVQGRSATRNGLCLRASTAKSARSPRSVVERAVDPRLTIRVPPVARTERRVLQHVLNWISFYGEATGRRDRRAGNTRAGNLHAPIMQLGALPRRRRGLAAPAPVVRKAVRKGLIAGAGRAESLWQARGAATVLPWGRGVVAALVPPGPPGFRQGVNRDGGERETQGGGRERRETCARLRNWAV